MPALAFLQRTVVSLPGRFHGNLGEGFNPEELLPVDPIRAETLELDRDGEVLEDDLMRLFGSERIANVMDRMGAQEGEVITHGLVTKSIERAQKRVEMNNFEARKRLLDYDDVMNQQREVIYDMRLFALEGGEDLKGEIWEMIEGAADAALDEYVPAGDPNKWDLAGLRRRILLDQFVVVMDLPEVNDPDAEHERSEIEHWVIESLRNAFHRKMESLGAHAEPVMSFIMLSVIDHKWKDHLYDLDHLKASISFRGWGQKDPWWSTSRRPTRCS